MLAAAYRHVHHCVHINISNAALIIATHCPHVLLSERAVVLVEGCRGWEMSLVGLKYGAVLIKPSCADDLVLTNRATVRAQPA